MTSCAADGALTQPHEHLVGIGRVPSRGRWPVRSSAHAGTSGCQAPGIPPLVWSGACRPGRTRSGIGAEA